MSTKNVRIKRERPLEALWSEPVIGRPVTLQSNGIIVKTSNVEDFMFWKNGDTVIYTKNSIYRGTDIPKYY